MPLHYITPVNVKPATAGSWQTVDLSTLIPAGASGALFRMENTSLSTSYVCEVRKYGSTDNDTSVTLRLAAHTWRFSGVDASRRCEIYVGHVTNVNVYLVGYTTAGFVFFDNVINKSFGPMGAWTTIDCAAEAPNAIGLIFKIRNSGTPYAVGIRKAGSTDARIYASSAQSAGMALLGCNASQQVEGYQVTTPALFYLAGYVTGSAAVELQTNAANVTPGAVGAWADLVALPSYATGGIYEVVSSQQERSYGLRKPGDTASNRNIYRRGWGYAPCDADGIVQGYRATEISLFLMGCSYVFRLLSASALSDQVVDVAFERDVDQASAENAANWTITKNGGGSVPSFTASRQADPKVVQLAFAEPLAGIYTIEATGVTDALGAAILAEADSAEVPLLPPGGAGRACALLFL